MMAELILHLHLFLFLLISCSVCAGDSLVEQRVFGLADPQRVNVQARSWITGNQKLKRVA